MTASTDHDFITTLFVEIHANDFYIEFIGMLSDHPEYHSFVDLFQRVLGVDYEGTKVHISVKEGSAILIEKV